MFAEEVSHWHVDHPPQGETVRAGEHLTVYDIGK